MILIFIRYKSRQNIIYVRNLLRSFFLPFKVLIFTEVVKIIDPLFIPTKNPYLISKKHSCINHLCSSNAQ